MSGWRLILGAIIRHGVNAGLTLLVAHGLFSQTLADTAAPEIAAGVLGLLLNLGWSIMQKAKSHWKFLAAMSEEPPQSMAQFALKSDNIANKERETPTAEKLKALAS